MAHIIVPRLLKAPRGWRLILTGGAKEGNRFLPPYQECRPDVEVGRADSGARARKMLLIRWAVRNRIPPFEMEDHGAVLHLLFEI